MATDKRLDQVSTLTDFDYALIVKGDQVAKASKQQLAELVGNLLYGATDASSLASVVAGQMKYNASKMVLDFRTSTTTDVTLPSYGMILLSIVYGRELYGLYLIQCWDGVISIKTINESGTKKFQLDYNTYQKYITITSPSAVPSVRLGWINITD